MQAIGENPQAARLCGIRTTQVQIMVYMISAFIAAIAGLLVSSRTSAADPTNLGALAEMDAIASVAIGGTSLAGGFGKIETTIYGVFILAIIGNMINLQGNINSWWQQIITGLLLIIVLMLQIIPSWRKSRA